MNQSYKMPFFSDLKCFTLITYVLLFFSIFTLKAQNIQSTILTPKERPTPQINGPKVFGVRPNHPIIFTIPTTGKRPIVFSASNLPKGVKLNTTTGMISGTIAKAGNYLITLKAQNALGIATRTLKIVVGENIALTPPMGWNHWNIFGTGISQEKVLAQAQAMVSSGLINHGWTYLNIDDGWQGKRGGAFHAILEDTATFQNLQLLCDLVHNLGLKIGIYSTPWVESYGHHIGG